MKRSRILLTICLIEMIVIIIFILQSISSHNELNTVRKEIVNDISPDNKYRLVLTEYGETFPLGASKVQLYVAYKDKEWIKKNILHLMLLMKVVFQEKILELNGLKMA